MANNTGNPSGANKGDEGTGIPNGKFVEDAQRDEELTRKYTDDDQQIADGIRQNHPNRNTHKDDATNAGGYQSGTSS
jgi:hypothetical protein